MTRRELITLLALGVLCVLAIAVRLGVGGEVFDLPGDGAIWDLRTSRACSGLVVGASLGIAGVLLQSLLRNPLASPDLMGLSSGAGLAITIGAFVAYQTTGSLGAGPMQTPSAIIGAGVALGLVWLLSQRRGLIDPVSMVLVGVIVSIMGGAATLLVQSLLPDKGLSVTRWFMGRLSDDTGWAQIGLGASITAGVLTVALFYARAMDASALSDDEARSVGVALGRLRVVLFVGAGVLTAISVVLAGPIGFVGLVCPHLVRLCAGPRHVTVLIGSALCGGALVVAADAAVKSIDLGGGRLPVGVLTAMIGGPVFLWLLKREGIGH